jgi:hypothetical protein
MLPSFATQTIEVVEPTMVEERGQLVPDWDAEPASVTPVPGCSVQPGASSEDLAGRSNVIVRWTVYAPPGIPVTAHSRVRYDGRLYSVDGEPARWPSATGALDHTVLLLIDWEG